MHRNPYADDFTAAITSDLNGINGINRCNHVNGVDQINRVRGH